MENYTLDTDEVPLFTGDIVCDGKTEDVWRSP